MMEEAEQITEKDVQQDDILRAGKVKYMLQHPGWSEIIGPELKAWRDKLVEDLLQKELNHEEFLLVRQSINAHDALIEFIKAVLRRGEMALEEQEKRKKMEALNNREE